MVFPFLNFSSTFLLLNFGFGDLNRFFGSIQRWSSGFRLFYCDTIVSHHLALIVTTICKHSHKYIERIVRIESEYQPRAKCSSLVRDDIFKPESAAYLKNHGLFKKSSSTRRSDLFHCFLFSKEPFLTLGTRTIIQHETLSSQLPSIRPSVSQASS